MRSLHCWYYNTQGLECGWSTKYRPTFLRRNFLFRIYFLEASVTPHCCWHEQYQCVFSVVSHICDVNNSHIACSMALCGFSSRVMEVRRDLTLLPCNITRIPTKRELHMFTTISIDFWATIWPRFWHLKLARMDRAPELRSSNWSLGKDGRILDGTRSVRAGHAWPDLRRVCLCT